MRLLIVSVAFPPLPTVASLRIHHFASTWSECGEDVTVLTTFKRDDHRALDRPREGFEVVELPYRIPRVLERVRSGGQRLTGTDITTAPGGPRSAPRRWLRAVRERTGILSMLRMPDLTDAWVKPAVAWCRDQPRWDAVVSSYGPPASHLVALALRRAGLAPTWIADFRDLWTDNPSATGLFPFSVRERALERQCLDAADLVVTVSDGLAESLRTRSATPVQVVPNGYCERDFEELSPEPAFDDGLVRLAYTGRVYPHRQDPSPLFRALAALRRDRPEIAGRLRVTVAGDNDWIWQERAAAHGVEEFVESLRRIPHEHALRVQRDADALLMIEFAQGAGVLSGKIFEYLRGTAPVLVLGGAATDSVASLVTRAGRGLALGRDPEAIEDALVTLVERPGALSASLARDDGFIAGFRREAQARAFLDLARAATRPREDDPRAAPAATAPRADAGPGPVP
ncbi:MAG: glycosyltransferase [Planctomycetota bacterium]|jgi:hypothetical protein